MADGSRQLRNVVGVKFSDEQKAAITRCARKLAHKRKQKVSVGSVIREYTMKSVWRHLAVRE